MGEAKWSPRDVNVSIGVEDEYAVESLAKLKLKVISRTFSLSEYSEDKWHSRLNQY